ncbi:MAG: (d)CMP kinase [Candidatus Berkiellales bacterium]
MKQHIPVITVDGPSGSGKGTLSHHVAEMLGWHFLDSGALYRVLAHAALSKGISVEDPVALAKVAAHLEVSFVGSPPQILLNGQNITLAIRTEECGNAASKVAKLPEVRKALLERQRAFLEPPGLVADGRDMGTVVFPEALLKIFLEASPEVRAQRRQIQLKEQGVNVSLGDLFAEIAERDARDRQRAVSPLVPASDAIVIDTTAFTIDEVFGIVMAKVFDKGITAKK